MFTCDYLSRSHPGLAGSASWSESAGEKKNAEVASGEGGVECTIARIVDPVPHVNSCVREIIFFLVKTGPRSGPLFAA